MMRHGAPRMVLGCRLWEPDVAGIACELPALQRAHHGVAIDDLAASGVHDVATPLHHADQLVVEQVLGLRVERRIDGDHVAYRSEEHTSELQSLRHLVCRLLLEKKN